MWKWITQWFEHKDEIVQVNPPEMIVRELEEIKKYCRYKIETLHEQPLTDVYETIKRLCDIIG